MTRPALFAALALSLAAAAPAAAQQRGIEIGMLDCVVEGGAGFIFGSTKDVSCTYTPNNDEFDAEAYFGVISKYGIDIGATGAGFMRWLVLAPSDNIYAPGALAGDYVGASAEASAGVGAGANLLIGGAGGQTFTLQPLSVQTQTGVNFALGVARFQLRSVAQ